MHYVYPCFPVFAAPYRNPAPSPPVHADILTASANNNWDCDEWGKELNKEEAYECYLQAIEWCRQLIVD